jgi:predicted nuclease of predicted toxin-antitoxin system
MGISPRIVEILSAQGHDAVHLLDQGLETMPDPHIIRKANHENRVLLTHDLDFGELMASSGSRLPSVIIFRLRNMRPERVNRHLRLAIAECQDALEEGAVVSVTEGQIRIRRLPIEGASGE